MKHIKLLMISLFGLTILMVVLALPAMASYSSDVDAFISNPNWKDGVSWPQRFPIATPYVDQGDNQYPLGCAAYAADFAYKTWSSHPYQVSAYKAGVFFNNKDEIRDGDVIVIYNWATDSMGNTYKNTHFYCVIQRLPDGRLYTAEGAFSNRVRITQSGYTASNPCSADKPYFEGYHNPNYETYVPNQAPVGYLDSVTGGLGCIHVGGWARDDDAADSPINVHIYVGGEANPSVPHYAVTADLNRSDVGQHAFDQTIYVSPHGTVEVYAYAIDPSGNGPNPCIGHKTVTIGEDAQAPVISNIQVSDISWQGYTVTCDVSDNVKVDRVAFPTWTVEGGQGDIFNDWEHTALGTIKGGKATYRVNITDHGKQTNCVYRTHIYAYDAAGNSISAHKDVDVDVPSPITNVRVTNISQQGYTVSCDVDTAWNIQRVEFPTWTENNEQDDLIWHTGTVSNGHATFTVLTSDHNNEIGCYYRTHIYAFDPDGRSAYVSQSHYDALRVRVPANLAKPEITDFVENGNTVHLEWTESPLIDEEDVRSYTIRAGVLMQDPALEITDIHALSADVDLSSFSPSNPLYIYIYAVNDTTGDESRGGCKQINSFCGEFTPPERMTMDDGETMNWLAWDSLMDQEHQLAIKTRMDEFEITSSDPTVVSVVPGDEIYGAKSLVAHKPGTVTLTLEFVNQPNTRRTTQLQVLPSENTAMNLPADLKEIQAEAFLGTSLKNIVLPEGCTTIGSRAFADSSALKRIYIPASVTSIEFDAFEGSDNLTICAPEGSRAIKIAMALGLSYDISD